MIYTNNLDEDTEYILVYHMTTPKDIIRLQCAFNDIKEAWIDYVDKVLIRYSEKLGIPREELSARPIRNYVA